ncbi:hypothetical protein C7N43_27510 [Sphingobacteriales bacterium UPWRP_1]|nr:hypothetical protein BVG80_04990 [Sphingobacteriales bacterium TSM_CSM]PSJ73750.1 hypothetical protein C7N43_27510 [Sphingobacteriales bacterium UPWRP_1]
MLKVQMFYGKVECFCKLTNKFLIIGKLRRKNLAAKVKKYGFGSAGGGLYFLQQYCCLGLCNR